MGAFEFEGSSLTGDLTGDGILNVLDVVALVNIVLGYGEPVDAGDLNGDGILNVLDVVMLVNIILNG
jgi:predicted lipoprotein with Yx(FWY)xxD motif